MTRKDKPHTSASDYHEGPEAAARFQAALSHIASLPKSAVPSPKPAKRIPRKK